MRRLPSGLLLALPLFVGCHAELTPTDAGPADASPRGAVILAAFFGLDNALPLGVELICRGGGGRDGMPVTFSRRVLGTPSAAAFEVTTRRGARRTPACVTLAPALDASERHTALLGGDLGDDPTDPPVRVTLVGSLALEGGGDARGLTAEVIPLAAGPSLVLALPYAAGALAGSACPAATTRRVVQATWNGGVTSPDGAAVGDRERRRMHVTVTRAGAAVEVTPAALADLGDNDNYVQLCLDVDDPPTAVRIEADTFVDPRGDRNAETRVDVTANP